MLSKEKFNYLDFFSEKFHICNISNIFQKNLKSHFFPETIFRIFASTF